MDIKAKDANVLLKFISDLIQQKRNLEILSHF